MEYVKLMLLLTGATHETFLETPLDASDVPPSFTGYWDPGIGAVKLHLAHKGILGWFISQVLKNFDPCSNYAGWWFLYMMVY